MTEQPILITSVLAVTDIEKHYFINSQGNLCDAATIPLGVSNADTATGEMAPLITDGIALVYSGAAVMSGSQIQSDDNAKAINSTDALVSRGFAIDDALAANELIRVKLF